MGLYDEEIQSEEAGEFAALKEIAFAVDDYLIALNDPEFATDFGGLEAFLIDLRKAHFRWEIEYNTLSEDEDD